MLTPYLEDLENRIVPETEEALLAEWQNFSHGHFRGALFSPARMRASPPQVEWPEKIFVNDALNDSHLMALQQFLGCSRSLETADGRGFGIRANYGTSILPSIFGAELFLMDRELNTLPAARHLPGGADVVRRILDKGVPDLRTGQGALVLEMGKRFRELMRPYPKISQYIQMIHPDIQGPLDVCESLWGSSLFLELVDEPDLVKSFLGLITETYIRFLKEWHQFAPPHDGLNLHWGLFHRGTVMLRDDSAMNLSPEMYAEFAEPYNRRILAEVGGGAMHFCGRGDHYIHLLCAIPGLYGVNLSQPQHNDMEKIFQSTVDRGIVLLNLDRKAAEAALERGRDLKGLVQSFE